MNDSERTPGGLTSNQAVRLAELVEVSTEAVVSRTLYKGKAGTLTVFAFDQGQELSEHSAPFDACVHVLDGRAELSIGGKAVEAAAGEMVLMPANVPHAVRAAEPFKILLIMMKGG
jgi:quercetin dioxygenase-like cupin family protein